MFQFTLIESKKKYDQKIFLAELMKNLESSIDVKQIRMEIIPDFDFIQSYCKVSSFPSPSIFFERFLDDEDYTLLRNNYWLRERFHDRENDPYELLLSHVSETPSSNSVNILICSQWNNKKAINLALSHLCKDISCFKKIIASYNVFRYKFSSNCSLDQAVFDANNIADRHDTLSLRFEKKSNLDEFISHYGELTFLSQSKVMASFGRENPEALKIMRSLGREIEIPKTPLTCPEPDISLLDYFQE